MFSNLRSVFLFTIFVEGFFTLSLELIAIRKSIPFVGNGTEVISVIISAVLLPLSLGYSFGGKRYASAIKKSKKTKLRHILTMNILLIVVISSVGFNAIFMEGFFYLLRDFNELGKIVVFSSIFLSIPSFLLGQTVPLLSNYFSDENISKITGKMLFLSTFGSFCGSLFTTIILMRYIGASWTLVLVEVMLVSLIILLYKNKVKAVAISLGFVMILLSTTAFANNVLKLSYENSYNTVAVIEKERGRYLSINRSRSSFLSKSGKSFQYVESINKMIQSAPSGVKKDILVIGAGGFTIGLTDTINDYTFIDIDTDLKALVETDFLKKPLGKNKHFVATEIRSYLIKNHKQYDLIIVDAYTNINAIPGSLVTKEFYELLKDRVKDDGIVVSNVVSHALMNDKYSMHIDNVIRSVFDRVRVVTVDTKKALAIFDKTVEGTNNLYIAFKKPGSTSIYTDDKNNYSFDKGQRIF